MQKHCDCEGVPNPIVVAVIGNWYMQVQKRPTAPKADIAQLRENVWLLRMGYRDAACTPSAVPI